MNESREEERDLAVGSCRVGTRQNEYRSSGAGSLLPAERPRQEPEPHRRRPRFLGSETSSTKLRHTRVADSCNGIAWLRFENAIASRSWVAPPV